MKLADEPCDREPAVSVNSMIDLLPGILCHFTSNV